MVRVVDYDSRRKDILRKTIDYYLTTAEPVSSDALLDNYQFDMSSATIRNVLNDLERKGFLTHPHTSAGRVPTDLGYRFYISDLMNKIDLSKEEKSTVDNFFDSYLETEDDALLNASRIISNLTHYIGIVNEEKGRKIYYYGLNYLLEQPEFRDIDTIKSMFSILDESNLLDIMNRKMNSSLDIIIGEECDCPQMQNCSLIIVECKTRKAKLGRLAVLGPKRMAYSRVIPIINYLSELVTGEYE